MKRYLMVVLLIISLFMFMFSNVTAKGFSASRLGIGFNAGGQRIRSASISAGFEPGFEAYAKYKMSARFFSTVSLGYSILTGTHLNNSTFETEMMTFDFKTGINLFEYSNFNSYAYWGLGAFRFQVNNSSDSYYDGAFMIGSGIEIKLNQSISFDMSADYRLTNTQDLTGIVVDGKDNYYTFRTGVTYSLSPHKSKEITVAKNSILEDIYDDTTGLNSEEFVEGLENYDEAQDVDMPIDKYNDLQTKIEYLQEEDRRKEFQIEELKLQLSNKSQKIEELQQDEQSNSPILSNVDLTEFSQSYQKALEYFYSKNHESAIQIFDALLVEHPNHDLSGNCYYWIGECYFGLGSYSEAIEPFQKVLTYPKTFKKDDALMMLGRSYVKVGDVASAKKMFEQIVTDFPDSEYYQKAQNYSSKLSVK